MNSNSIISGGSGVTIGTGLISRDKLEPFVPPTVVAEKPLTLDQQVARAKSIVQVTVAAQAAWDKHQIALEFTRIRLHHGL